MTTGIPLWLLIGLAALVTYAWRGGGVLLGRKIDIERRRLDFGCQSFRFQ